MADLQTVARVLFYLSLVVIGVGVYHLYMRKGVQRDAVEADPVVVSPSGDSAVSGASAEGLPVRAPDHQYVAHLRLVVLHEDWDDESMTRH